ncbi:MAG: Na/Pi symporter, partial [Erysipelotrichales bacterium]|nr:Na/Pi symporter [Erysipelotrichales bacterium]
MTIGTIITAILQSSSATTALTISLVHAKLMKIEQAVAIIMGANIGTTMTAFLIGIDIETFAVYFIFIG